ncbi:hypothetical protein BBW79_05635 [Listeria monocytogenes]|nr:hypothetical protein [Listeria monocytogenes]
MEETIITLNDVEAAVRKLIVKVCEQPETSNNSVTLVAITELKKTLLIDRYEQEIRAIQLSILRKADKKLNAAFTRNNYNMVAAIAELLKASL